MSYATHMSAYKSSRGASYKLSNHCMMCGRYLRNATPKY